MVNSALDRFFPEGCGVEIIAEPGRFYVASAFSLIAQIHSIREVKDNGETRYMYYINDGIYGSFNCLMYDHHVVHPETLALQVCQFCDVLFIKRHNAWSKLVFP